MWNVSTSAVNWISKGLPAQEAAEITVKWLPCASYAPKCLQICRALVNKVLTSLYFYSACFEIILHSRAIWLSFPFLSTSKHAEESIWKSFWCARVKIFTKLQSSRGTLFPEFGLFTQNSKSWRLDESSVGSFASFICNLHH